MRELKLRAWHKTKKIMAQVSQIDLLGEKVYTLKSNGEERKTPWHFVEISLMQCIGHPDKNGTDIYEKDVILQTDSQGTMPWLVEPIGSLERDGNNYGLCASPRGSGENYFIDSSILDGTVAGNIEQNAELLEIT